MNSPGRRWRASHLILQVGCLLALLGNDRPAAGSCPEPPETDEGGRRGLARREFVKAGRHELNLMGGVYASDIMGAAPLGTLSYTFHMTEDFALEAAFGYTYFSAALAKPVQDYTGYTVLEPHDARIYTGALVWHPFHGKFMFFQAAIPHFDIYLSAGVGVTDSRTSKGLTYHVGGGLKIFSLSWMSLRLDVRDHILVQEVLASESITNNLLVTLGVGFWFPFGS